MKPCALCFVPKCALHVIHCTFDEQHTFTWHPTTRPYSTSSSGEIEPCADPRHVRIGFLAEPKQLAEDKDLAEREDLCVKPSFFQRPSIASTCDSAESTATPPPESDMDDEQIRALLASPLYLPEREASAGRSQENHSARENLMSSSSQVVRRSEKYKSNFLISAVPTWWNLRTDLGRRLKDNSDAGQ